MSVIYQKSREHFGAGIRVEDVIIYFRITLGEECYPEAYKNTSLLSPFLLLSPLNRYLFEMNKCIQFFSTTRLQVNSRGSVLYSTLSISGVFSLFIYMYSIFVFVLMGWSLLPYALLHF
jgi:hypothetical protein